METLPFSWYTDPAVAAAERDAIFRRAWQYVGHTGELDGPGSFFPSHVAGLPVVVVRDGDGALRGFVNVCRHRGAVLVEAPARRGTIQCPYHAWTYGLDGRLRGAPRSAEEPGFPFGELGLAPVQVDTWGPFVFATPDAAAPPLAEALGDLPGVVAGYGLDVDALRFHSRAPYEIRANWKVAIENYLECYHCKLNHPGLVQVIDEQEQLQEVAGARLSQVPPIRANGSAPYDLADGVPTAQYHLLFPSLKVNVNPGRPNLSIGPLWPTAPDRTSAWLDYFFAADADPAWIEAMLAFDTQVGSEDTALVEAVQRGAGSGGLAHGRLMPHAEVLIGAFQALVRERLADA